MVWRDELLVYKFYFQAVGEWVAFIVVFITLNDDDDNNDDDDDGDDDDDDNDI